MPKKAGGETTRRNTINCPGRQSGGTKVADMQQWNINKKFKAMTTILLLAAGALSFALFYKTVHYFEKI